MENFIPFSSLSDNQFSIAVKQGVNYSLETDLRYNPIEMDKKLFDRIIHAIAHNDQEDEDGIDTFVDYKYYSVDEILDQIKLFLFSI